MNFGAELDDDVFERPTLKRNKETPVPGGIIGDSLQWFLEVAATSTDKEEVLKCLRYKADYLYWTRDYTEARKTYEQCLKLIPPSNLPASRECMEGLARSLLHTGHAEQAVEWAFKLHEAAESADHKLASWNLLATVCHSLGRYEEELEALHCCLESLRTSPEFWLRLAYCYSGLFKITLPGSGCRAEPLQRCCDFKLKSFIPDAFVECDGSHSESSSSSDAEVNKTVHVSTGKNHVANHIVDKMAARCEMCTLGTHIISACLIRTRLLISNSSKENDICRHKNNIIDRKVATCLTHLEVDQEFIDEATEILKPEMYGNSSNQHDTQFQEGFSNYSQTQDSDDTLITQGIQSLKL